MRSIEPLRLVAGLTASLALVLPMAGASAAPAQGPRPVGSIEPTSDNGNVWAGTRRVSEKTNVVPRMVVRTANGASAQLRLRPSKTSCTILTQYPTQLTIVPRANVILHLTRGELVCQLTPGKKDCTRIVQGGPNGALTSCDPVFALIVRNGKTTVKVTRGYAVVSGRNGQSQAIVVGRGRQVVVPAGGDPGVPRSITLTAAERRATASLQARLRPVRDTRRPVVSVAKGPSGFSGPTASFLLKASEPSVEFTCALDRGAFHVCRRTPSFGGLAEGLHRLSVSGVDTVGNEAKPKAYTWTVDATPPATSQLCDGIQCSSAWYPNNVKVTLAATDSSSGVATIRYTLDGSEPTPTQGLTYVGPITVSSPTTIQYRAFDRAGNTEAVRSFKLQVDTKPPVVSLTAPRPNSIVTSPITATAAATDNVAVAKVTFFLDGNSRVTTNVTPYQAVLTFPSFSQGMHTVTARAFDLAGHTTDQTVTFTLVLPDLTVTMSPVYIYCPSTPCVPSVTFKVTNGGSRGANAGPFKVLVRPNVGAPLTLDVASLAAGASVTLTAALPRTVSSVTVTADSGNTIPETQESNNTGPTTTWPPPG